MSAPMTLQEIMDEELARKMVSTGNGYDDAFYGIMTEEEIAMAISLQEILQLEKNSKINQTEEIITFDVSESEEGEEVEDGLKWDELLEETDPNSTKHNFIINSIKNAKKVENTMNNAGDMDGIMLPNRAVKGLSKHIKNQKRKGIDSHKKIEKSKFLTFGEVFDNETVNKLFTWQTHGVLDDMQGVLSSGKEATVFAGQGHIIEITGDLEYAIKIYKTVLSDFKNRREYVEGDYRYSHINLDLLSMRKFIQLWAKKEYYNLIRMYNNGMRCPRPFKCEKHLLIMEFIGENGVAAPLLKDAPMTAIQMKSCYKQCIKILRDLYQKCKLVHGDFSEYNVLFYRGFCYVIDVGQAVENTHLKSDTYLERDCINISNFFKNKVELLLDIPDFIEYIKSPEITVKLTDYINQKCAELK